MCSLDLNAGAKTNALTFYKFDVGLIPTGKQGDENYQHKNGFKISRRSKVILHW